MAGWRSLRGVWYLSVLRYGERERERRERFRFGRIEGWVPIFWIFIVSCSFSLRCLFAFHVPSYLLWLMSSDSNLERRKERYPGIFQPSMSSRRSEMLVSNITMVYTYLSTTQLIRSHSSQDPTKMSVYHRIANLISTKVFIPSNIN